jgi:iron complex transport system substrate-binding protein
MSRPVKTVAAARGERFSSFRRTFWASSLALLAVSADAQLPSVASINLCGDQLVLSLADPEQILTVSWLAADPEESMLADEAARFPLNYGSAEELLRFDPDVVIAGTYTATFTRALLKRLGYDVIEVAPETTLAEIESNLRLVGAAIGRAERAQTRIAELRASARAIAEQRSAQPVAAVVVRPGGFTVGANSLAHEIMLLAGLRNVAAEQGLDRWGSLSMETLLRSKPDLLILSDYHAAHASLANVVLQHPALARLSRDVRAVTVPGPTWACGLPQSLESAALLQRAVRADDQ